MENIRIVVHAHAVKSLGGGIITLFKRIYKYVNERIDHKCSQKQECRQQIEPGFRILLFHKNLHSADTAIKVALQRLQYNRSVELKISLNPNPFLRILCKQKDFLGLQGKMYFANRKIFTVVRINNGTDGDIFGFFMGGDDTHIASHDL